MLTPKDLRRISEEKALEEARKSIAASQKAAEAQKQLSELFMTRQIQPDAMDRVMARVKQVAEQGHTEVMAFQFPSSLLTDGGRRINNFEPDWPESLQGFPKRAYEFWREHLQPLGYRLHAQVLDYPGGKPGDVGLFLKW
jgi:hypothetical protein